MTSTFTWLDYSEREKRKMLDVIDLFGEQETRDELGIGTVRDAFADLLFPGTSTIQTRARYFLFVPWIYLDLERRKTPASAIADLARRTEVRLIDALATSLDPAGTIGVQARATLKRLPSNVYWQGLGVWGIRLFPGSQDQYHRSLNSFLESAAGRLSKERDSDESPPDRIASNWHSYLPPPPEGFPKVASFKLTPTESDYLRERIMSRARGTLLAFLADSEAPATAVDFVWRHPLFADFPSHIRELLEHARSFSGVIHGASLLYNLMLAERAQNQELAETYTQELSKWSDMLEERGEALSKWERKRFWELASSGGARIPTLTRVFIDSWLDLALAPQPARLVKDQRSRDLVHRRESSLKGALARLDNQRALELWRGAAGTAQLNYRWHIAARIVLDIFNGLRG